MPESKPSPPVGRPRISAAAAWPRTVIQTIAGTAILFVALVLRHADVLWLPPYEDQAAGLWAEAEYLVDHNFDYRALRYDEAHFNSPGRGARSYMVSVLPTLTALVMKFAPSREACFFIAHLATLAWVAGLGSGVFVLLRPFSLWTAGLTAAALLTTPLMEVQAEMLGMDAPVALCAVLTLVCLLRERFVLAALTGSLAFLCKPTGSLATAAVIGCLIARSLWEAPSRRRAMLGVAVNCGALLLQIALFLWGDPLPELRTSIPWPRWLTLPHGLIWFPDAIIVTALAGLATAWHCCRQGTTAPQDANSNRGFLPAWAARLFREPLLLFSWLMVAGMFVSMARWIVIPRYYTAALPFVYLTLSTSLASAAPQRRLLHGLLLAVTLVNLVNRDGRLFPDVHQTAAEDFATDALVSVHSCAFQERSREYLTEQRSLLAMMHTLERDHPGRPLLAPAPYSFLASRPRLGYVTRPLETHDAADFAATMSAFCRLQREAREQGQERQPVLLRANMSRVTLPEPTAVDRIIARGNPPDEIVCFMKNGDSLPTSDDDLQAWYLEATWNESWPARRAIERVNSLAQRGEEGRALAEVQSALHARPLSPRIRDGELGLLDIRQRIALGQRLTHAHRLFPGVARVDGRCAAILASLDLLATPIPAPAVQDLSTPDGRLMFAVLADQTPLAADAPPLERAIRSLAGHDFASAIARFEDVGRAAPSAPEADAGRIVVAVLQIWRGDLPAAQEALEKIAEPPRMPEREYMLAYIAWQRGNLDEAARRASALMGEMPELSGLHKLLGLALARRADGPSARRHFQACQQLGDGDWQVSDLMAATSKLDR